MSRVVVLGGTGFIGRHTYAALGADALPLSSRDLNLEEVGSAERLAGRLSPETTVVMCGGLTSTVDNTIRAYRANVAMAVNLARAARRRPVRSLVYLSSTFVYGRRGRPVAIDEDEPTAPDCPYSHAKLVAERLLRSNATGALTVLRLPGVYGPDDGGRSVVGALAGRIASGQAVELVGGGRHRRDYVHVDDVAQLILRVVESPYDGVLNAASGEPVRIVELAALLGRALGVASRAVERPPDGTVYDLTFDVHRLRARYPDAVPVGVARRLATSAWAEAPVARGDC